jgi:hypothetical protein
MSGGRVSCARVHALPRAIGTRNLAVPVLVLRTTDTKHQAGLSLDY